MEKVCCLCFLACNDYKLIQDESGDSTDIYDVTVKYFDPMIITEEQIFISSLSRVICCGCWTHIYDFHEFQQRVLQSRTSLLATNHMKVNTHYIDSLSELQVENKIFLSNEDIVGKEAKYVVPDQEDEMPLSLLQEISSNKKSSCDILFAFRTKDHIIDVCSSSLSANNTNETTIKTESVLDDSCDSLSTTPKSKEIGFVNTATDEDCKSGEDKAEVSILKHSRTRANKCQNEKIISTSADSPKNLLGSVRKKQKIETHCKKNKLTNGKLKEKSKENDIFIAKWKPILDCDLCATTVSNFDAMRDHFRVEHKTRCYIKCCERKFYRRYVLTEHIRLHVNPETHKCDICGKRSTNKYNLKLHKQIVHSDTKQFECEVCKRLFNQKPTLDRHLLTHIKGDKKFFCKECDRGYMTEDQLKYHQKTAHNADHVCDQCGKTIHSAAALKKHLMEHAGIERPKYPCDICGVELVTNYGLRRHKAAYHHDGSTAYVCSICGKVSSSHNALVSHKKNVHENGRRYKCTYCDKAFKRAKVLREHIATHTGVDLYQCPHCPQTFKVSANMHHHRKRAHPVEWAEGRRNRTALPKVDIQQVTNQVIF